jgi:hypothetical protein
MIIWLASYPKSGNTWLRLFLNTLLYNQENLDINNIKINQFPQKYHFEGIVEDINSFKEVTENYINAQSKINFDNKIKFLKTHSANWEAYGTTFTNNDNSLGAIHIVRDPRNVISSILNHYSSKNYKEALTFMCDKTKVIGDERDLKNKIKIVISSWGNHYNSWRKFKKNNILVSYEKLLNEPNKEFFKICNFLTKITNLNFEENQILQTIEKCNFKNLQKAEQIDGFIEASVDKNGNKKKFFNLGPNNNWKKLLDKEIVFEIEKIFENEMRELNYI